MNTHSTIRQHNHTRAQSLSRWILGSTFAFASLTAAAIAETRYTLTVLPTPASYEFSVAYHINDQGYVAGCSSRPSDSGRMATIWKNGAPSVLGRLKDGTDSLATAINSKGVVTGDGDDGDGRPLGWVTSSGKLVNFFSNNGGNTHPVAISEAGEIGGYYIKGFSNTWRGAIWKIDAKDPRKSVKIDLPLLAGGDPTTASAIPFGFNKTNEAAGWVSNSEIGQHAAFWNDDAAHTLVDLGVFGADWSSVGNNLNDLGQVVGSSHPPFGSRPVMWNNDAAHTPYELPLLPGDNYGSAHLINNEGTMVGWSAYGEPGTWNVTPSKLVVWVDGAVYDLQALVAAAAPGWTVHEILDINNLGQLCGHATCNGVTRAVVLNPVR